MKWNKLSLMGMVMAASIAPLAAAPGDEAYVTSFDNGSVLKFEVDTGAFLGVFVPAGGGGLDGPTGLAFGPDGNLYVASFFNGSVLKYDGLSGKFMGVFVSEGSGGLQGPMDLSFGPDGNLYVVSSYVGGVFRYDSRTGAFIDRFTDVPSDAKAARWRNGALFVSSIHNVFRLDGASGALKGPITEGFPDWGIGFDFGPDGHVYVANYFDDSVMKFNSQTGERMGTFARNCFGPQMIEFGPNEDLYVASYIGDSVDCFDGRTGAWKRSMWGNGLAGAMDVAFRGPPSHSGL